jgi:hypothetical protein
MTPQLEYDDDEENLKIENRNFKLLGTEWSAKNPQEVFGQCEIILMIHPRLTALTSASFQQPVNVYANSSLIIKSNS